jgi:hypothetical protein
MQFHKLMRTRDPYYDLEKTDEYQTLTTKFDTVYVLFCYFRSMYVGNFRTLTAEFIGNEFYYLFIKMVK